MYAEHSKYINPNQKLRTQFAYKWSDKHLLAMERQDSKAVLMYAENTTYQIVHRNFISNKLSLRSLVQVSY